MSRVSELLVTRIKALIISCAFLSFIGCSEIYLSLVSPKPAEETVPDASAEPERVVVRLLDYDRIHDLSTNPYPDAFATARVLPLEGFGSSVDLEPCILKFRVLKDRKRLGAADFQPSDLIGVTMIPAEEMSDSLRSIQVLETYSDPELDIYYASSPRFLARPHPQRADSDDAGDTPAPPAPVLESDSSKRLMRLDSDLEKQSRIQNALGSISVHLQREGNGSWSTWQDKLKGFRSDLYATATHESDINYDVRKSMEPASYRQPVEGGIPAFDAVKQLADKVEAAGIDFVLLSVPSRIETYPEWYSQDPEISDQHVGPTRLHYLQELLEEGIEVIDAGEFLRNAKLDGNEELFWQGPEFHLSPQGYEVLGAAVGDYIRERNILEKSDLISHKDLSIDQEMVATFHEPEVFMSARRVMNRKDRTPFVPNRDSPVFFFGDSTLFWWQTNMYGSCGLISQLAYEVNHVADWQAKANLRPHHAKDIDRNRLVGKKLWIQVQTSWVLWTENAPHRNVHLESEFLSFAGPSAGSDN